MNRPVDDASRDAPDDPAPPIRIGSADDPRIAVFRDVRERDRVGRDGVFIAEGLSVLTVLLTRSRLRALSILVEEERAARLPVLAARGSVPLYLAPQRILDTIAGFHLHRGILAAGRIPAPVPLSDLPTGPLRLAACINLANHDNVGGVYRNAAAFGAAGVVIDGTTASPFYRKAIRVGVGAPLVVPTFAAPADLLAALAGQGVTAYALTPNASDTVGTARLAARAAFLLGTEGEGLPGSLIAGAQPLAIAIAPGFDSLNVATASGIALHAHALRHGI